MPKPLFRVKRYAHQKYKFLARAKVQGKWKRSYFATEREAIAFADEQNAKAEIYLGSLAAAPGGAKVPEPATSALPELIPSIESHSDLSRLVTPTYTGPHIQRYFGDHWSMHLPFAYELMRELKPGVFVELGVWKGESYFTFCQSAADHMLRTRCYGIDTWRGDVHMGEHDPEIAVEVARYNWRYSSFSELKIMTFMEALADFPDNSIDLLHIDGAHTYQDVKRDFESWLPKLAPDGIILFHDVMVRDYGCGVWKLWDEIARPKTSFHFEFGYGLGVWKKRPVSRRDPPLLRRLFSANREEKKQLNEHYAAAAAALALWRTAGPDAGRNAVRPFRIQLFADQGDGFSEASSIMAVLSPQGPQVIRFDNIQNLRPGTDSRLRIDPVDHPALVNISSVRIIREADKAVIYSAERKADFEQIKTSAGLLKLVMAESLFLIALHADPQIFLPSIDVSAVGACRLEIVLQAIAIPKSLISSGREAVEAAAAAWAQADATGDAQVILEGNSRLEDAQARVVALENEESNWRNRIAALQELADASQQALRQATEQCILKDAKINTLRAALTKAHTQRERTAAEAKQERSKVRDHAQRIESLHAALKNAIEQARTDAAHSTAALEQQILENEQLRSQLESKTQGIADLEEQIANLNVGVDAARSQWNQVSAELRATRFENAELQSKIELNAQQAEVLQSSQRELRHCLEETEREAARLTGVVSLQRSANTGLERNQALLQRRLDDVSRSLVSAGKEIKRGDSECPSLVDLISEDIRRIARPSLAWRLAGVLGILRLAPASAPRTVAERRALANDLNAGLRSICLTMSSSSSMPGEAAAEVQRLMQLHRQTPQLVQSLKVTRLIRGKDPVWKIVHWARRIQKKPEVKHPAFALLDAAWYLGAYPDVAAAGVDPARHYFAFGVLEGRNPNPVFDSCWYSARNQLGTSAQLNPVEHYWDVGARTGLNPSPLFDGDWYLTVNPDVATTRLNPLLHYLTYGAAEGRNPHPLFDLGWYLIQAPEARGLNPIEHYLKWGGRHGLSPHPLFDPDWYLRENGNVRDAQTNAFVHYLEFGAAEARNPHPLFNVDWYLEQIGNVPEALANPLRHYVLVGARERRSPTPLFDPEFYAEQYPDAADCADLLKHYLLFGWRRGLRPSPSFDARRYVRLHPEVAQRGLEPLTHSVLHSEQ
jgi:methyltransferase family protein